MRKWLPLTLVLLATPALAQNTGTVTVPAPTPKLDDVIAKQLGDLVLQNSQCKITLSQAGALIADLKKKCGKPCEDAPAASPVPGKK